MSHLGQERTLPYQLKRDTVRFGPKADIASGAELYKSKSVPSSQIKEKDDAI